MNTVSSVETLVTDHLDLWTAALKRKSTAGRGSSSKVELYGIKKLRELILELAVRGLLVPQDPNDEPASELLKKIAAEKARLVKAGKIKKETPPSKTEDQEKPFDLPHKWQWSRLIEISANIHYGYTASSNDSIRNVRLLRITDIQDDAVEWESVPGCEIEADKIVQYQLVDDDILIARTGGTIGKSYLVKNISVCAVFASYLIRVRHLKGMSAGYKKVYLGSQFYWRQLYAKSMGTGQPNVNGESLKGLVVPVPPLAEQHRIVAKVDELMALCDQLEQETDASLGAHQTLVETLLNALTSAADHAQFASAWQRIAGHFDTLFTTEESIAQLKQTILQLAVMGKLVPQDPNGEPACELLKKIATEKAKLLKEGKIKKERPLPIIAVEDMQFELPAGWALTRLGSVIDLISGQHLGPTEYFESLRPGAIPYLTGPAEFGPKSPEPTRYTNERRAVSILGDILLTVKGSGVGKTNIVSQPEIAISRQLMALRSIAVDRNFLNILLATLAEKFQAQSVGIAIPGISREDVLEAPLYLPSLAEQHRIVAKVDELMALCDQLKSRLSAAQTTQLHLADALVEQAIC